MKKMRSALGTVSLRLLSSPAFNSALPQSRSRVSKACSPTRLHLRAASWPPESGAPAPRAQDRRADSALRRDDRTFPAPPWRSRILFSCSFLTISPHFGLGGLTGRDDAATGRALARLTPCVTNYQQLTLGIHPQSDPAILAFAVRAVVQRKRL